MSKAWFAVKVWCRTVWASLKFMVRLYRSLRALQAKGFYEYEIELAVYQKQSVVTEEEFEAWLKNYLQQNPQSAKPDQSDLNNGLIVVEP